jgi:hypothetical protein
MNIIHWQLAVALLLEVKKALNAHGARIRAAGAIGEL